MKKLLAAVTILWLASLHGPSHAQEKGAASAGPHVTRYAVLMSGRPAGFQTTTVGDGGERLYAFEYNDRGRGPKLSTRVRLGEGHIPTLLETTGNGYLKEPVDERFSLAGGRASWKNRAEQGAKEVRSRAFYVSMSGAPEEAALLAQALLAAPGGRLALLPEGEASIRRAGELQVEAAGRKLKVVHYLIAGLGFTPISVWLDEGQNFFATGGTWFAVVREGWESVMPALVEAQERTDAALSAELARTLARKPTAPALVFKGANLFDAETATSRPGTTVVVVGNRVKAVGPDGKVDVPAGAEVIDARGKTLLPGLWDMHVHIGQDEGILHLAAGVTTVRDLANDVDELRETRRKFDAGEAIGPRVLMAGFMDGPGPYAGPTKVLVSTEEQARQWVDEYAGMGYVQIKVYSSIKPELVPAIVEQAHKRGLRVSGHVPAYMTAEQVVKLGFDELQHTNFLFLNFLADTVKDTRTPVRFTAVAENAANLDLNSERVQSFIKLLKERQTVVDPTVSVFEGMFTARPGHVSPDFAAVADRLPPQVRRGFLNGGLPVPEGKDQLYRDSFRALLKMVYALHRAGVPLVAGTDSLAGFALHRELELYVEAGIPAPQVLQLATLGAARIMKRDKELGSIAPGKLADMVLVNGDPTAKISDIRHTVTVVKDGTLYDAAKLYEANGIRP